MTLLPRVLSEFVCSDDYLNRLMAGLVVEQFALPGATMMHRVETVEFVASNINQRRTSVDLDFRKVASVARRLDIEVDCVVVGFLPKSIPFTLDVLDASGGMVHVVKREIDSRFSQCLLVSLAMSNEDGMPGLPMPGPKVWQLIFEHVYRFPIDHNPFAGLAFALDVGLRLRGIDSIWWATACQSARWRSWFLRLGDMYLLTVDRPESVSDSTTFEYVQRSGRDDIRNPYILKARSKDPLPSKATPLRLYDWGQAGSEHVRLIAPKGTFLSGGHITTYVQDLLEIREQLGLPASVSVTYRRRWARHEIVLYENADMNRKRVSGHLLNGPVPGNCLIQYTLWPETRSVITPLRLLAWYLTVATFAALLGEVFTAHPLSSYMTGGVGSAIAILYFAPSVALGLILQPDRMSDITWRLYRWTHRYAGILVVLSILMALCWVFKVSDTGKYGIIGGMLILLFCAGFLTWRVEQICKRIGNRSSRQRDNERLQLSGRPTTLRVTKVG